MRKGKGKTQPTPTPTLPCDADYVALDDAASVLLRFRAKIEFVMTQQRHDIGGLNHVLQACHKLHSPDEEEGAAVSVDTTEDILNRHIRDLSQTITKALQITKSKKSRTR